MSAFSVSDSLLVVSVTEFYPSIAAQCLTLFTASFRHVLKFLLDVCAQLLGDVYLSADILRNSSNSPSFGGF